VGAQACQSPLQFVTDEQSATAFQQAALPMSDRSQKKKNSPPQQTNWFLFEQFGVSPAAQARSRPPQEMADAHSSGESVQVRMPRSGRSQMSWAPPQHPTVPSSSQ
jgi:hypothetical protein